MVPHMFHIFDCHTFTFGVGWGGGVEIRYPRLLHHFGPFLSLRCFHGPENPAFPFPQVFPWTTKIQDPKMESHNIVRLP